MAKKHGFLSILIPSATVFISSACIMILELVASRLIARHLGSSLYTWTAVIGIVLAGITIGNYIGGRIADRFKARKTLSVIFLFCSISCVITIILNNIVGNWLFLWTFSWPVRVFSHVSVVFLLPSVLLGTISPVVAKMALDQGLPQGRTVGDIYACGAAGSIAGTFLAGYFLIAAMGTTAIIWTVAAVLLMMSLIYWLKLIAAYLWAIAFTVFLLMGMAPYQWAQKSGSLFGLRIEPDSNLIYEDDTQYCYVAIKQTSLNPEKRSFFQDKLTHSLINMENPSDLQYFYTKIYSAITHDLSKKKDKLSIMVIGGGGYVYPRYVEQTWPGSRIDVVEIDPGVTKAAIEGFGLSPDTTIKTINMDARNYVDDLIEKKRRGQGIPAYDFIYEDALNDFSIPYQLVTKEFNENIAKILAREGVYMLELIDTYDSGQFLGSVFNTLEQTFANVFVLSGIEPRNIRNTFVLIASNHQINLDEFIRQHSKSLDIWYLDDSEINTLREKSRGIVLTDDYAPVENMLAPIVRESNIESLSHKYRNQAKQLKQQNKLDEAIEMYQKLLKLDPAVLIFASNEIAIMQGQKGRFADAIETLQKAIQYNEQSQVKMNIWEVHLNLASLLKKLNRTEESKKYFNEVVNGLKKKLAKEPDSLEAVIQIAKALIEMEDYKQATEYFYKVTYLQPYNVSNYYILSKVLEFQGRYDEAITTFKKANSLMTKLGRKEDAVKMQEYIEFLESSKSQYKE